MVLCECSLASVTAHGESWIGAIDNSSNKSRLLFLADCGSKIDLPFPLTCSSMRAIVVIPNILDVLRLSLYPKLSLRDGQVL